MWDCKETRVGRTLTSCGGQEFSERNSVKCLKKILDVGRWQGKVLLRNKHLACTKRQMELKMVQCVHDMWSVNVQVHPNAFRVSGPGLIRDVDYCRGVAQVTLGVLSMQVYLRGPV